MADDTKGKEVKLDSADVSQHKRMAAGEKCNGQYTPAKTQGADKPVTKPNA